MTEGAAVGRRLIRRRITAAALAAVTIGGAGLAGVAVSTSTAAAATSAATTLPTGFGGIAVDPATDHVFVSSPSAGTVTALDFAGNVVGSAGGLAGPGSMVVDGPTLYVALRNGGAIAELSTGSLQQTGTLGSGSLTQPGPLVMAGGLLWTSNGACDSWTTQLASVNPATGVVASYAMPTASYLGYCIGLAAAPQLPDTLLAFTPGLDPATISRIDVSTGVPVVQTSVRESDQANLKQIAVNPDGTTFVTASGAPYDFEEFRVSDLSLDGTVYPGNTYPDAVVTSSARGGLVVGGMDGMYDPDAVAYHPGSPGTTLLSHDFGGSSNTVVDDGIALSPDGSTLFAVTGTASGSGTTTFNVLPLANTTGTSLAVSSPNPPGSAVTLTATVGVTSGGFPGPSGTVTFAVDGTTVGSATLDTSGQASVSVPGLATGSHTADAFYGGSTDDTASSAQKVPFEVGYSTVTSLSSSANPTTYGEPVTFTAAVTTGSATPTGTTATAGPAPTGTVTFADGGTALATVALDSTGTASYTPPTLALGTHQITASYSGDANDDPSSAVMSEQVQGYGTTTSLSAGPDPSMAGQSVTFTATVAPQTPGEGTPTGTVTFYGPAGSTAYSLGTATLDSSGSASLTTASLPAGTTTVTASYSGDATFAASSGSTSQTVNRYSTATSLTTSLNPSTAGTAVTFTAAVSVSGPYGPTGTVTFYDGSAAIGSAGMTQGNAGASSPGTASITLSGLSVGTHEISATYTGDPYNAPSSSGTIPEAVNQATSSTTLTSSADPVTLGQSVTLTATVTGDAPSGRVAFTDAGTYLGGATVGTDGRATLTTTLPTGQHSIQAQYGGDADNTASTSAVLSETVNPDSSTTSLTSSVTTAKRGTPVTLTATVTAVPAGTTPTGTVTFYLNGTKALSGPVSLQGAGNGTATATYTTTGLPHGRDSITAVYSGCPDVTSSTSPAVTVSVK